MSHRALIGPSHGAQRRPLRALPLLCAILTACAMLFPVSAEAAQDSFESAEDLGSPPRAIASSTVGMGVQGDPPIPGGEPLTGAGPGLCSRINGTYTNELSHGLEMGATVWYTVTGTGGPITVATDASNFDTVIAVYRPGVPSQSTFIKCDDDSGPVTGTSELTFPSQSGVRYLVQVGGWDPAGAAPPRTGQLELQTAVTPSNDRRAAARVVALNTRIDGDNRGATNEWGESTRCGSSPFDQSVWYRVSVPQEGNGSYDGTLTVSTGGGPDTVLSLYSANGGLIECGDDTSQGGAVTTFGGSVSRAVSQGTYDVQVGGYLSSTNGAAAGGFQFSAGWVPNLDHDGDGEPKGPGRDCNDDPTRGGAAQRHGRRDIPGNRVNEDCAGDLAPYPRVDSLVELRGDSGRRYRVKYLRVYRVPRGATIRVRCLGPKKRGRRKSCGRVTTSRYRGTVSIRSFRRKRLSSGTTIQVFVTRPGWIGFYQTVKTRSRRLARRSKVQCINVGDRRLRTLSRSKCRTIS